MKPYYDFYIEQELLKICQSEFMISLDFREDYSDELDIVWFWFCDVPSTSEFLDMPSEEDYKYFKKHGLFCPALLLADGTVLAPTDWYKPLWNKVSWRISHNEWIDGNKKKYVIVKGKPRLCEE